jgi:Putative Ig domain
MSMKKLFLSLAVAFSFGLDAGAATVNWAAGIDHGLSLASGAELPIGSLIRLGWFRDPVSGLQLTDAEIVALASTPSALNAKFVEAGSSTVGSGFTPAVVGHFAAATTADTSASGLNLAGKQMYVWALNAATLGAATQQAILYWSVSDSGNPDGSPTSPASRWAFPAQDPIPGSTTIDLTDLTTGTATLASGARLLVGTFPTGTSSSTTVGNFGLGSVSAPLTVVTPSPLVGGVMGVLYGQTLTAQGGTAPYAWTISAGTHPTGLSLSAGGSISGIPTADGVFNFTVQVSDGALITATRAYTVTIATTALSITSPAALTGGTIGNSYSVNLVAAAGTPPYSWALAGGALPDGLSLNAAGHISGSPSAVGTANFAAQVTDGGSQVVTQAFSISVSPSPLVISTPASLSSAVVGLLYSKPLIATGGTAPFTWTMTSGTPPTGISLVNGVLTGTPSAVGSGTFTIEVQDANSLIATRVFTLGVNAGLTAPSIDTPNFPVSMVSDSTFSYTLTAANFPSAFFATGLPKGLVLNKTTGVISGRPTVSGVFMVQVKASNTAGTSPPVTTQLIVRALPNHAVGSYLGWINRSPVNSNLGGRIDLKTTSTGSYTLKITQGKKITSMKGNLVATAAAIPHLQATHILSGMVISLDLNPNTDLLTGSLTVGAASAQVSGWRRVWNKTTNPSLNHVGYYSVGIDLTTNIGSATVPQGTGFASFTVGVDGGLSVKGKTSDGSAIATAGFIGPSGQILVHQLLYASLGSVVGQLTLTPDASANYAENTTSGSLTWFKPTTVTRTYPATFGPLTMAVDGKYLGTSSKTVIMGLPSPGSAALNFTDGGIGSASINPNVTFTFTPLLTRVLPVAGSAGNLGKTTLVLSPKTGAISGAFTLVDGVLIRKGSYQGMIVRTADTMTKAFGYFLLPQIPAVGQTSTTSPILSGQVNITQ